MSQSRDIWLSRPSREKIQSGAGLDVLPLSGNHPEWRPYASEELQIRTQSHWPAPAGSSGTGGRS